MKEEYTKFTQNYEIAFELNMTNVTIEGWNLDETNTTFSAFYSDKEEEEEKSIITTQEVLDALRETEDRFEWDGEKFIMKPMDLRDQTEYEPPIFCRFFQTIYIAFKRAAKKNCVGNFGKEEFLRFLESSANQFV